MFKVEGFEAFEVIAQGGSAHVYRARRVADALPVVFKAMRMERPSTSALTRFRHEYLLARGHGCEGVVRALSLHSVGHRLAIAFEDSGGKSLARHFVEEPPALEVFLKLARQIAAALGELHQADIIHKDLNPSNIVWNSQSDKLELIDLGISTRLSRQLISSQAPHKVEGTLAYLSPEQTGRMNRSVDRRTDFYALGVTLYELLTGVLPFKHRDPLEMFHAHLAVTPPPPSTYRSDVPEVLDRLILTLMSKTAEERYQTAWGLRADLEALEQMRGGARLWEPMVLGERDVSGVLQIPERLYGRDEEVARLQMAFERAAQGNSQSCLVRGRPGIGKTALIRELNKPITRRRGYFISGKADQVQQGGTCAVFRQALGELARQILCEPEAARVCWRARLEEAVGRNGQIVCELAPEFEAVLGVQAPLEPLGAQESRNRFNRTMQRFFAALASAQAPIVVALDDLQWADPGTLSLLQGLLEASGGAHILWVMVYRDQEVDASHGLHRMIGAMESHGHTFEALTLEPLSELALRALLCDTLHASVERVTTLAKTIRQHTAGNPFFVNQFLASLSDDGLIWFDVGALRWCWDDAVIASQELSDNVVEFTLARLKQLPPKTQELLQRAASVGGVFSLRVLAMLEGLSVEEVINLLWPAFEQGALYPLGEARMRAAAMSLSALSSVFQTAAEGSTGDEGALQELSQPGEAGVEAVASVEPGFMGHQEQLCRFVHDRVHQAAYVQLEGVPRQQVHLRIGRLLRSLSAQSGERLFEVVDHLNKALPLIEARSERVQLAEQNLAAARQARDSAAYSVSVSLLEAGLSSLERGGDVWVSDAELALELKLALAEAHMLTGDFEAADALYEQLLARCDDPDSRVRIGLGQNEQYLIQGRYLEAIAVQRACLALLGYDIPSSPAALEALLERQLESIPEMLAGREIEELVEAPMIGEPGMRHAVSFFYGMWLSAFLSGDPALPFPALVGMTTHALVHGNCALSSYGYVGLALVFNLRQEGFRTAHRYGLVGVALADRFEDPSTRCKALFFFAADVHSWTHPLQDVWPFYERAYQTAMECGDWLTVGYVLIQSGSDSITAGRPLRESLRYYTDHLAFLRRTGNSACEFLLVVGVLQPLRHLLGETSTWESFDTEDFDEEAFIEEHADNPFSLAWLYAGRIRAAYLCGARDSWPTWLSRVPIVERFVPSHSKVPESAFYGVLMALELAHLSDDEAQRRQYEEEAERLRSRLRGWAQACPANITHKLSIIEAREADLAGDFTQAARVYERAVSEANEAGFINNEGLAYELYGRCCHRQELHSMARHLLDEARYRYERWGASAKVSALEREFSMLTVTPAQEAHRTFSETFTNTADIRPAELVDAVSLVRASQAISGEIEFNALIEKMMRLVVINAGAQRGVLLLAHAVDDETLQWTLEASIDGEVAERLPSVPLESEGAEAWLHPGVVRLAHQQRAPLVLDDAAAVGAFVNDPVTQARQLRSVLCLPLVSQGQVMGALYLENNLNRYAFTTQHVETLKLLATQIVISLTNARLYLDLQVYQKGLEGLVEKRTQALTEAMETLRESQVQLLQAKRRAEVANNAKSAFLSHVTHELRTPLTTIMALLELGGEETISEEHRGTMLSSARHLQELIEDLLDAARGELSALTLQESPNCLAQVFRDTVEMVRQRASEKGLTLELVLPPSLPLLMMDAMRMRQVLINLIDNAIKYTPTGGIIARVIILERVGASIVVRFEVEDTGPGIDAESRRLIMEPFVQLQSAKGHSSLQGIGLGLHIVGLILKRMGSALVVEEAPGGGSLFAFELSLSEASEVSPEAPNASAATLHESAPPAEVASPQLKVRADDEAGLEEAAAPRRVLIVDDMAQIRKVMVRVLSRFDVKVVEAESLAQARQRCDEGRFELIMLDHHLPDGAGLELARQLRARPEHQATLMVTMTANPDAAAEGMALGVFNALLTKPFSVRALRKLLGELLGVNPQARA